MIIWGELDNRLSAIRRYNLFRTIQTQTVAEHVFNVERMSLRIAREWFGVEDSRELFKIMEWAHHHEDLEAVSGDFPAMAKPYFDEAKFALDHTKLIPLRGPGPGTTKVIVKLADLMDCFNFFVMEKALGSVYVENHIQAMIQRIRKFARNNCPDQFLKVDDWLYGASNPRSDTYHKDGWSEDRL